MQALKSEVKRKIKMQLSKLQGKKKSIIKGIIKYILEFQKVGEGYRKHKKKFRRYIDMDMKKLNNIEIKLPN